MTRDRRGWGAIRKLPSGSFQASYVGPDGLRYKAPMTYQDQDAARIWLKGIKRSIDDGEWDPHAKANAKRKRATVAEAFDAYLLKPRSQGLKPRTEAHYREIFARFIDGPLGNLAVSQVTEYDVNEWYTDTKLWRKKNGSVMRTYRAHAYQLLSSMLAFSLPKGAANPCQISRGGSTQSDREIRPATLLELTVMTEAMPARYAAMIPLTAWCALRFGEVAELRRKDIDLVTGVVRVRRGVTRANGVTHIGTPKAESIRTVAMPPHIIPIMKKHLSDHVDRADASLLFPAASGGNLNPSTLYRHFYAARDAAGRPDMHFHDLRHAGGTMAARAGATLTEQMARLGHKTPAMAIRYQHVAAGRDAEIAEALSRMAELG